MDPCAGARGGSAIGLRRFRPNWGSDAGGRSGGGLGRGCDIHELGRAGAPRPIGAGTCFSPISIDSICRLCWRSVCRSVFPSTSGLVLSAGGTSLVLSDTGERISEIAWYSGGGGLVNFFSITPTRPEWRVSRNRQTGCAARRTSVSVRIRIMALPFTTVLRFPALLDGANWRHQFSRARMGGSTGWNSAAGRYGITAESVPAGRRNPVSGTSAVFL